MLLMWVVLGLSAQGRVHLTETDSSYAMRERTSSGGTRSHIQAGGHIDLYAPKGRNQITNSAYWSHIPGGQAPDPGTEIKGRDITANTLLLNTALPVGFGPVSAPAPPAAANTPTAATAATINAHTAPTHTAPGAVAGSSTPHGVIPFILESYAYAQLAYYDALRNQDPLLDSRPDLANLKDPAQVAAALAQLRDLAADLRQNPDALLPAIYGLGDDAAIAPYIDDLDDGDLLAQNDIPKGSVILTEELIRQLQGDLGQTLNDIFAPKPEPAAAAANGGSGTSSSGSASGGEPATTAAQYAAASGVELPPLPEDSGDAPSTERVTRSGLFPGMTEAEPAANATANTDGTTTGTAPPETGAAGNTETGETGTTGGTGEMGAGTGETGETGPGTIGKNALNQFDEVGKKRPKPV